MKHTNIFLEELRKYEDQAKIKMFYFVMSAPYMYGKMQRLQKTSSKVQAINLINQI